MTLEQALAALRQRNEPVPRPLRLPTEAEVTAMENKLRRTFHPDFRRYLLAASDVVFDVLEPVTLGDPTSPTYLPTVARDAWQKMDLPKDLLPFCEDNGDYYCINKKGEILFWSHNDRETTDEWPDLAAWIEDVWLGEAE
jgi:hypothetical protein